METLSSKLISLRKAKGLSKKEIAIAVGVHPSSIGNLEKGSIPQSDLLYLLAKFFNVSMEYLINDESDILSTKNLSNTEAQLVILYRQLSSENQRDVLEQIQYKLFKQSKKQQ